MGKLNKTTKHQCKGELKNLPYLLLRNLLLKANNRKLGSKRRENNQRYMWKYFADLQIIYTFATNQNYYDINN